MPDLNFPVFRALLSRTTTMFGLRIPVVAIALPGFVLIWMSTVWLEAPAIEAELEHAVNDTLSESGFARMRADMSGRDVTLSGSVSSLFAGSHAASLAAAVTGVRVVTSVAAVVPLRLPYLVVRRSQDDELVISGQMPNSEIAGDMLQRVSSNIRHQSVVNRLVIDPEVTLPPWAQEVTAVAQEANRLQGMEFEIGAGQVAVGGLLDSRSDYTVLTHRLLSFLEPAGREFINRVGIVPRNIDLVAETVVMPRADQEEELDTAPEEPDEAVAESSQEPGDGGSVGHSPGLPEEETDQAGAADTSGAVSVVVAEADGTDSTGQDADAADMATDDPTQAAIDEEPDIEGGSNNEKETKAEIAEKSPLLTATAEALTLDQCQTRINDLLMSDPITFPPNVIELTVENTTIVANLYKILIDCPTFTITIAGHTDSRGSEASNLSLSQQRAGSVMAALLTLGVEKSRLEARGFGSTIPVASNETSEGRRLNRRIEIILREPERG